MPRHFRTPVFCRMILERFPIDRVDLSVGADTFVESLAPLLAEPAAPIIFSRKGGGRNHSRQGSWVTASYRFRETNAQTSSPTMSNKRKLALLGRPMSGPVSASTSSTGVVVLRP